MALIGFRGVANILSAPVGGCARLSTLGGLPFRDVVVEKLFAPDHPDHMTFKAVGNDFSPQ